MATNSMHGVTRSSEQSPASWSRLLLPSSTTGPFFSLHLDFPVLATTWFLFVFLHLSIHIIRWWWPSSSFIYSSSSWSCLFLFVLCWSWILILWLWLIYSNFYHHLCTVTLSPSRYISLTLYYAFNLFLLFCGVFFLEEIVGFFRISFSWWFSGDENM